MKEHILNHLKDSGHYEAVGLGLSLAAVSNEPIIKGTHHLWVLQMATDPQGNSRDIGPPLQIEKVTFGIAIVVKAYNDRTGSKTDEVVDNLILNVRRDLFGFMPDELKGTYDRLTLAGGNLQKFADGSVVYVERFMTKRIVTEENIL